MSSLIFGSSHIIYGKMLCIKVFVNIYAQLDLGGGGGSILNDSQKMLCTPLHDDNRPILCSKGPLYPLIIVSGINLVWQMEPNFSVFGNWSNTSYSPDGSPYNISATRV